MKLKKFWLIGVAIIALLAVGLVGCSGNSDNGTTIGLISNQQEGIWVTGYGKVTVTPDIANLVLGVNARENTVVEAQASAAAAMNEIMAVLTQHGIAEKDIQTQQFNIYPVYSYDDKENRSTIIGYEVTNTVNVTIRDLSKAGTIVDATAQTGGDLTRVNSISFSVEDPTQYYTEARELAMEDANNAAAELAALGGVKLGKPTFISQTGYYQPDVREYYYGAAVDNGSAPTPISPGTTEITLTVQVTYSIIK